MYCGARTIGTVTPQATYQDTLQIDAVDRQLIIGTNNHNDVTSYELDLVDYIDGKELQELSFYITIEGCPVTGLSYTEPNPKYSGTVPNGPMTINIPSWSVIPSSCDVSPVFEAQQYDNGSYKPLPDYITYSDDDHSFSVELDDDSYAGTYIISLIGKTPNGYQDPPISDELFFEIEIVNPCVTDSLTNPSTIDSFEYIIDYSGLVTVPIQTYDQSDTECPT